MSKTRLSRSEDGQEVQHFDNGPDDHTEVYGYRKNKSKTAGIYALYGLTAGLLRLFFHWHPRFRLRYTHDASGLEEADKVLVIDNYKGKHKTYFVEEVFELSCSKQDLLSFYTCEGGRKETRTVRGFTCKKIKYLWDDGLRSFVRLSGLDSGVSQSELHRCAGFTEKEQILRRIVYGTNDIDVPLQGVFRLFVLEALTPFYVFQLFSLVVWMCEEYYYYGIAIVIMSVVGIGSSIVQTRKNQNNLRGTLHQADDVQVKRGDDFLENVPTTSLVPGDVIVVPSRGCVMHCDAVLLNGTAIVNESMLTGESVPVMKTAVPNVDKPFDMKEDTSHVLYGGTKIIQTRYYGDDKVVAVVIRTGFLTSKGQLVKSILYPPPADFKFDQDSYKFMIILAAVALAGVVYTIVSKSTRNIVFTDIIIKALDTITIVIPPALPAAMTVGKLYALSRLKAKRIFCINSRVINVSGSVNCMCFDKTGTLTEDGLDMWAAVPVSRSNLRGPIKDRALLTLSSKFLHGMATCHSLTLIDDRPEGDPLDLKMFEFTGWFLEEPDVPDISKYDLLVPRVVRPLIVDPNELDVEIGIVHQYQFSSTLQRMSVITKAIRDDAFRLYCKGSPETIASLCVPQSVPENISGALQKYTEKGYRVIAMATKPLEGLSMARVQRQRREDAECDLEFLGLVVFENRLKPQSAKIVRVLREAAMKVVMITGDNKLTALSVAKECGIVEKQTMVVDVTVKPPTKTEEATQIFNVLQIAEHNYAKSTIASLEKGLYRDYFCFVLTGDTWNLMKQHFPADVPKLVTRGAVFSRMSSDQKQELVEELKELGYYVAMCGDGSNDCGALKAAHVGVSLSEAESSVAAPFTYKEANIACMPEIVKEGRAALVTSFGIFKFMITYSLTEFCSVIILYGIDTNLGNIQFLYIDLCIIMVLAALFGKTKSYSKKLYGKPPMTTLLGFIPLTSLGLHLLSVVIFQVLAYHIIQTFDWFVPFQFTDTKFKESYENFAVFGVSVFQYIGTAIVYSKGSPYRRKISSNYWFSCIILFMIAFNIYAILHPPEWLSHFLELMVPPKLNGKVMILLLALSNFLLTYILEEFVVDFILLRYVKPKFRNIDTTSKKYLRVERELALDSKWRFGGKPTYEVSGKRITFDNEGYERDMV